MNKITLIGKVTYVSKMVQLNNGSVMMWCGVDSGDVLRYTDITGKKKNKKIYHTIMMFNDLANKMELKIRVGYDVEIVGRLAYLQMREQGIFKILPRIIVDQIKVLNKGDKKIPSIKNNEGISEQKITKQKYMYKPEEINIDDLPFE